MKNICILSLSVLLTGVFSSGVLAKTFKGYQPSAALSLQNTDFEFTERDVDGRELVNESGDLLGLKGNLSLQKGKYEFSLDGSYLTSSSINYDGDTQTGTPFQTNVETEIFDLAISATDKVYERNNMSYHIGMGLGYRYWERDIRSRGNVSGLFEESKWFYFLLNNRVDIDLSKKSTLSFNALYRDSISSEVMTNIIPDSNTTIDLQGGSGYQLGAELTHIIKEGLQLVAGLTFDQWSFDRSDTRRGNLTIAQPENETEQLNLSLGLSMRF